MEGRWGCICLGVPIKRIMIISWDLFWNAPANAGRVRWGIQEDA